LNKEFALRDRYVLQEKLVEALENTEYHQHIASKVENCRKRFNRKRCEQNHTWAVPSESNSCALRICPHCAHRRSKILAARTQALLMGKEQLRYAVLSERNSDNLQAGVASLWKAWTRLRRSVRWKRKVKGCIVALEVTYNADKKTWHPHLNVLMEGEYFPFEELNQAWIKATEGNGRSSRIQAATKGVEHELLKYVLKVATRDKETSELHLLFDQSAALDEFLSGVYGVRLLRSYGTLHGLKLEDEENPREEEKCPDCGSTCIVDLGSVSMSQLEFDFEKEVYRVVRPPTERDHALRLVGKQLRWRISSNPESIAIAVEARQRMRVYEKQVALRFAA
jgi:hypothetical protein